MFLFLAARVFHPARSTHYKFMQLNQSGNTTDYEREKRITPPQPPQQSLLLRRKEFSPPLFSNTKSLFFFFFVVDVHMVQGEEERRRKGRASSAAANSPLLPLSSVSPSLFLLPPLVTKGIKCVTFAKKKSSEFNFAPVHLLPTVL